MFEQETMIKRVRELCAADDDVVAAWMYGSFAWGEGDTHSDIEFLVYIDDEALKVFDPVAWLSQIKPVELYFVNEFGVGTAIFANLIRGEFHFEPASEMANLRQYKEMGGFPSVDAMLIYDATGELEEHLRSISGPGPDPTDPAHVAQLWHQYLNWILFGSHVLARGERARALEILGIIHRHLLWFARLDEGAFEHWPTPSRNAEHDLSQAAYGRFVACTATLRGTDLEAAYRHAWAWGRELRQALAAAYDLDGNMPLLRSLDERFATVFEPA